MKYYLRSIREDGFGECVVPEMKEPMWKQPGETIPMWLAKVNFRHEVKKYEDYLSSLPVSEAVVTPELAAKIKIGWVENVEEEYQLFDTENICGWHIVSKEWYDMHKDKHLHKILLVEKKPVSEETTKQEAQRLIDGYTRVIKERTDVFNAYSDISFAKECAALCAERISEFIYAIPINDKTFSYRKEELERWRSILNHIKNEKYPKPKKQEEKSDGNKPEWVPKKHYNKLLKALSHLCHLKKWKDEHGKDSHYEQFQPEAWAYAFDVLESLNEINPTPPVSGEPGGLQDEIWKEVQKELADIEWQEGMENYEIANTKKANLKSKFNISRKQ